jgi:hypothetical protein
MFDLGVDIFHAVAAGKNKYKFSDDSGFLIFEVSYIEDDIILRHKKII